MSSNRLAMSSRVPQSAERVDSFQVKEAMAISEEGEPVLRQCRFDTSLKLLSEQC